MVPIRFIFRSRWAALAWGAGICLSAAHFAEGSKGGAVDATNAATDNKAQDSAVGAEDSD